MLWGCNSNQTKFQSSWNLSSAQKDEVDFVGGNKMTKGESIDRKKEDEDETMLKYGGGRGQVE